MEIVRVFRKIWGIVIVILVIAAGMCIFKTNNDNDKKAYDYYSSLTDEYISNLNKMSQDEAYKSVFSVRLEDNEEAQYIRQARAVLKDKIEYAQNYKSKVTDMAGYEKILNSSLYADEDNFGRLNAKKYAKEADLILYVADSSTALDENDEEIIELFEGRKVIVLLNKSDLEPVTTEQILKEKVGEHPVICVSAKDETGFEQLEDTLKNMFLEGSLSFNDEVCITNMRHKAALMDAKESLKQVTESIAQDMPEDFFSIDLMSAYESLGTIIGEAVDDEIFSKFCMGK